MLGSIAIGIQIPAVQFKLVSKATDYLSKTLKFPIKIEGIHIDWFDQVVLEGVSVEDQAGSKMIYLKEAEVDFKILSLFKAQIELEKIILSDGKVNLIKQKNGSLNMTEFIDALSSLSPPSKKESNKKSSPFVIPAVDLDNMYFSYTDVREPDIEDFDHNHFGFDSIYAKVTNLTAVADTFKITVSNLNTYETHTFLKVHELDVEYLITGKKMEFNQLFARIGHSVVKDYLCFSFNQISEMEDFNDKIVVTSHLKNSKISLNDLSNFAPDLKPYKDQAIISGDFKGKVVNFGVTNLEFAFGKNSKIYGSLALNGLPELNETFIDFTYKNLKVDTRDLKQYSTSVSYDVLKKFGVVSGKGQFIGFGNDFVTHGKCSTALGYLETDINLKIHEDQKPKSHYKGHLKTHGFDFGKLIDKSEYIGLLDMNGEIEGSGFELSDAKIRVVADIHRLGVNHYDYHNIKTNAQLSESLFNGDISIADSNLVFNATGKVDLSDNKGIFNISAHLDKANLKPLHFSLYDKETILKTDFYLDYTGLNMDEIEGKASFINTYLLYNENKEVFIDSLTVQSHKNGNSRIFSIESDLLSAYVTGDFQFSTLLEDIQRNFYEYQLNVNNNSVAIENYYKNKVHLKRPKYTVDFNIIVEDVNSILAIYVPHLFISEGVFIKGNFTSGYTSILNLHTHIDTLLYNETEIYKTEIQLSTSKISDSVNTLGMLFVSSETQQLKSFTPTENFYLEGIWNDRTIDFQTHIKQRLNNNNGFLMGKLTFQENKKELQLRNSYLDILNKSWKISDNNFITFAKEEITFKDFTVTNGEQSISMEGTISNDEDEECIMNVDNFKLENLNSIAGSRKLDGVLNGTLIVKDLFKDIDMSGNVLVHDMKIDNFLIGNIKGFSEYNNSKKMLDIKVGVERMEEQVIDLSGYIKANDSGKDEEVNLTAKLNDANLELLNPIMSGVMSNISGTVTGDIKIEGTINKMKLNGAGDVKKGKFKIDYLGTSYTFEDKIYLEENMIGFRKLVLNDLEGNHAVVDGGIYHDGFKNFVVDMKGAMKTFNILNTTEEENNLFYGVANVSGDFEMLGAFSDLQIKAFATSNKGTKIFIPLNTTSSLEQKTFIKFRKFGNVADSIDKESLDLSGINMDLNLNITPEAYVEIIFDKRAGDIIRGNGQGNIKLKIDTRGDFSMYGNYVITEGYYNFTLAGLINKEFKINPNSSISWSGDPYSGQLNINAMYTQFASLLPIIDTSNGKSRDSDYRKKYPTNVLMGLQGNLMSPNITLGIDIPKYPVNAGEDILAFQSKIKSNEYELNRQVFSLLVLGMFSAENSFTGVANSTNNLSELLSNQLSNWLSQVDNNLQIDINLNSLNRDALNTFQLRVAYTALDGRLRITRDGTFQNTQSNQTNNLTNIAGEWTVEYLLSKNGNLRLKLFNKANQNVLLNTVGNNVNNSSAGFSVLHTQSFNSLKDLFSFGKKDVPDDNTTPELIKELPTKKTQTKKDEDQNLINYVPPEQKKTKTN